MANFKLLMICLICMFLIVSCAKQVEPDEEPGVTEQPDTEPEPEPMTEFTLVKVTLDEWSIMPEPTEVKAGKIRFEVVNDGNYYHELDIVSGEEKYYVEDGVPSGETKIVEVELVAGTYKLSCPIPGHIEKGMVAELLVS
ncbi:sulfocyanin-like copper-binding protein [Nanoarchaeota archaeon]